MKKLKVGDTVKVISGSDKGKIGTIKTLDYKKSKIIIDSINVKIKHTKASGGQDVGKIINFAAPIHISNVMVCDSNGISTRVSFVFKEGKKVRYSRKLKTLI